MPFSIMTTPKQFMRLKPGHLVICDYQRASVPPEMDKQRPSVVLTVGPSTVVVIPFSTQRPHPVYPYHIEFAAHKYTPLHETCWLKPDMFLSAARDRLWWPRQDGKTLMTRLSSDDMEKVRYALLAALGLKGWLIERGITA
jgi:uncharacterized protein YifN (PemK superfamily)